MPTVIKAADRQRAVHGVAFNFEDLAVNAEDYLKQIRAQAGQILLKATQEAEQIRQAAANEGRLAAERAADQLLDQKLAGQLQTLLPALHAAINEIQHSKQGWLAHWEQRAIHLAAAMAARVCRRELERQPEMPLQLVKEALQLAAGSPSVRVLLNPADLASLGNQLQQLAAEVSRLAPAELVADERIARGGCRVETQYGAIDQQFESQLNRIEEELT
jgi:flagellar assembly protein FliH